MLLICLIGTSGCKHAQLGSQSGTVTKRGAGLEQIALTMELSDPVSPTTPVRIYRVVQSKDQNDFPVGYAMQVVSEVCADKKCRLLEVTLHWNAVGGYERLDYPPGKPLTKKEHEPFTADDYAKLDRILKDQDSLLARQSLPSLGKPGKVGKGFDGVTGATPATIKESVVEGAAYTTWVMWHWANGEIVPRLRNLTGQSCTPPYLKYLLHSKDRRCRDFALKYLMDHHPAGTQFQEDVLHILETGDSQHIELSLRYLTTATKDKERLQAHLIESFYRMNTMNNPMVLEYFASETNLPSTTMEGLTAHLNQLPYFQIHLILRLLEQRNFFSKKTEADVAHLLDKDDFFIARRACEHLMKQDLSAATKEKVNAFRERNRDRL